MAERWDLKELAQGDVRETTFWQTSLEGVGFVFLATHLDGRRVPVPVYCNDKRITAGIPCRVRLRSLILRGSKRQLLVDFLGHVVHEPPKVADLKWDDFDPERDQVQPMPNVLALPPAEDIVDQAAARAVVAQLKLGRNALLLGPSGCGKASLGRAVAAQYGYEFVYFNCAGVDEASDFLAPVRTMAGDIGVPARGFVKSEVLLAIEAGLAKPDASYLVYLDDIHRAPRPARSAFLLELDRGQQLFEPTRGGYLALPANVRFLVAADASLVEAVEGVGPDQLRRFAPVRLDFPPPASEVEHLCKRYQELEREMVERVVDVARSIRLSTTVDAGPSLGALDDACGYMQSPIFGDDPHIRLAESLRSAFCSRYPGNWSEMDSPAGQVWMLVNAALADPEDDGGSAPVLGEELGPDPTQQPVAPDDIWEPAAG